MLVESEIFLPSLRALNTEFWDVWTQLCRLVPGSSCYGLHIWSYDGFPVGWIAFLISAGFLGDYSRVNIIIFRFIEFEIDELSFGNK